MSRATFLITLLRISIRTLHLRSQTIHFTTFTIGLVVTGIALTVLSAVFCTTDVLNCFDQHGCLCRLPMELSISALTSEYSAPNIMQYSLSDGLNTEHILVDACVDIAAALMARRFIMGSPEFPNRFESPEQKHIIIIGFSSTVIILIINTVFWLVYLSMLSTNHLLYLCLANSVVSKLHAIFLISLDE